jgi:ATPase subunit of ABC transporter with duplicated ATPase domains
VNKLYLPNQQMIDLSLFPILLQRGQKIRIKGPNGIGKTTCLENIVRYQLSPETIPSNQEEDVMIHNDVFIGYYRQDFYNLDHEQTVIDTLYAADIQNKHTEQHIRVTASSFFLKGDIVRQQVKTLSEGQKGLLTLACLVLQEPAILIMDEPTNHMNFRHLPAIAKAINQFKGGVLVVSHDEDFIEQIKFDRVIDLHEELTSPPFIQR